MRIITASLLATGLAMSAPSWAQPGPEEAMNKAGCLACHSKEKKIVGPSFQAIAAKYKGQDAVATLIQKVRTGGKGNFGPVPMAPTGPDKMSDADLKLAVEWILKQ